MSRWVKGIVGYAFSIGLALLFALYLSGRVGWFLVLAFVLAPPLSLAMTWLLRKKITIEVSWNVKVMNKGEEGTMSVRMENAGFWPTPSIVVEIEDGFGVSCEETNFMVSVLPRRAAQFEVTYRSRICGRHRTGVRNVFMKDYFGMFSVKLKMAQEQEWHEEIAVVPDILEFSEREDVIEQVSRSSAQADDSEDTTESNTFTFAGFPGYQNREYLPGDPLKRINWKLSAKRGRLLVRLDDEVAASSVSIVIDPVFQKETAQSLSIPEEFANGAEWEEQLLLIAQTAIEGSLGIARVLMNRGYSLHYRMWGKDGWEKQELADERDLTQLQLSLAHYGFSDKPMQPRLPEWDSPGKKSLISVFCTPALDEGLERQVYSRQGDLQDQLILYAVLGQRKTV